MCLTRPTSVSGRLICVEIKFFGPTSPKLRTEITRDARRLHFAFDIILIDIRAESTSHFNLITQIRIYIAFICVLWLQKYYEAVHDDNKRNEKVEYYLTFDVTSVSAVYSTTDGN